MATFQHPVVSLENKPVGNVELLPEVFKLEDINQHLIWEAVRHFLAKPPAIAWAMPQCQHRSSRAPHRPDEGQ